MPKPKSDSRNKIVGAARTLLRRQGYHATGLAQIVERSGAPRGSVYFLFPGGKEEVAVAAVEEWTVDVDALLRRLRAASPDAPRWITAIADHFAGELQASGFVEGLPVTTIVLDSVPGSAALSDVCRRAYDTWLATLVDGLIGYGVPADRAGPLATLLLASLEGGAVVCRAYGSTEPLDRIVPQVLGLLPVD
jgi:TetR/AcrR family transcriptional regulator, lmrAB and yxaGH operons repressor